ncbi:metallo-beta-lactamase superfamily protein [Streptohalobacillus salinus]|uniref:Metallo-beta-lactamase superfamily protein n=1 Tax=Streptohalobacillus salinus TaxID=621096 RepID=A0A2V3WHW5_9BACI|nr:MBL fold metallo-hydrolase [Streptohalobacillus salinus]PXW93167.1 metallo-beta-lactamase superfamily protein [Streptohalobacillus salinus]
MEAIEIIDVFDLDLPERTASYYLKGEVPTLIETSAAPSIPFLLQGLQKRNIDLDAIQYVIVTHIHLDHAGGVGLLLKWLPNATVIVHPRGLRHLVDPSRLIESAKMVYEEAFDPLFDPIIPVPKARIRSVKDGETLVIDADRMLTFYDTPGHAKHHLAIHDSKTNSIFTGDTLGTRYPQRFTQGTDFILPSTSPVDFDPDQMLSSMKRIRDLDVARIYFGHFGYSDEPIDVFHALSVWLQRFTKIAEAQYHHHKEESDEALVERIQEALFNKVETEVDYLDPGIFDYLKHDLHVNAQGLVHYYRAKSS